MDLAMMIQQSQAAKDGKPMPERCEFCGATVIRGVRTDIGRRVPLDPKPSKEGNHRIVGTGEVPDIEVLGGRYLAAARAKGVPLYVSHYYTCGSKG